MPRGSAIKLSVVIPTIGRKHEVACLLSSVAKLPQEFVEVIIIDQNPPGFLDSVVAEAAIDQLKHYLVNFRGAARARNVGLKHASGDVINFCDDDATMVSDTYEIVESCFSVSPTLSMASFKVLDPVTNEPSMVRFAAADQRIHKKNFHTISIEFAQFWRRDVLLKLEGYNETLGVGTYYGAEEGLDLLIRAIEGNFEMVYFNRPLFYHPSKKDAPFRRYYQYSRGSGRLCCIHFMKPYVQKKMAMFFLKSVIGVFLYLFINPQKALNYSARMSGFIVGVINSMARRHLVKTGTLGL